MSEPTTIFHTASTSIPAKRIWIGLLVALVFLPFFLNGQTVPIVDGKPDLNAGKNELQKVLTIFENKIRNQQKDSLKFYLDRAQRLAINIQDPALQAKTDYLTGDYFHQIYLEYDSAAVWYQKALDLVTQYPNPALRLEILGRFAYNVYTRTAYQSAAAYATECIELAEKLGDRRKEAGCLATMSSIMAGYGGEYEKSLQYVQQAMQIYLSLHDTVNIIKNRMRTASILSESGRNNEAMQQIDDVGQMLTSESNKKLIAEYHFMKAVLLTEEKKYDQALIFTQNALPIYESLGDRFRIMHILLNSGAIYLAQGQPAKAVEAGKKVIEGELRPGLFERNEGYKLLYEGYKMQGDAGNALLYHERYFDLNDSIRLKNKDQALAELDTRFQTKEKERRIADQAILLSAEKSRRFSMAIGLFFAIAAFGIALFAFFRVRKARKQLALQNDIIRAQKEDLEQLDELKSQFFANVSHELRTPLTLMLGPISSVLKSPALEPRNISLLELATQQGRQLLNLVNEILDLTKLEAGKLELDESPIALFPLVNRIAGYFENHASRQGIGFLFDFRADRALHLELDAPRFETILNNLLSNAVKFTPAVAEAQVRVQVDDLVHSIRLTVSDTGKGIHPADLPQVFDRFYQSRQPGASSHGGTGIGLALCRELVELMHGKIRVESELGKGTSFFVEIPKKEVFGMDVDLEPDAQLQ